MTSQRSQLDLSCVDDVPLHLVRGNQTGILLSIIATVLLQQVWILLIPLAVQLISRQFGVRYNPFVHIFASMYPVSTKTESRELLRFNNLLAILFLTVTLAAYAVGWTILAYIALAMLTVAVVLALCGFCLGCFMYFQWKQFIALRKIKKQRQL
ncbi:DUF4395 domain-containing protein [Paenibacillus whitsoniae]|uniref:DUF4395 domain-containing protein n=1 Tax=Paenibacillus whitsoniae TaxID=2496558 RepID=A0A430JDE9_9BACL|nr:DUF4395 domain-containing protein [Paenibacillus whitsoniae]RTE09025.1 DUF4395 domain-containing protein [Paenibacillus whitsoniae]